MLRVCALVNCLIKMFRCAASVLASCQPARILCGSTESRARLERWGGFVIRQDRHPFALGGDDDVGDDSRVRRLGAHGARDHALAFFQLRHGVPPPVGVVDGKE